MQYLFLLILLASQASKRVVRRLIKHTDEVRTLWRVPVAAPQQRSLDDPDMIGWLNIMATCHDHAVITHYARSTYT